jgi:hypothetical protein
MLTQEEALQVDVAIELHVMGARSVIPDGNGGAVVIDGNGQQRGLRRYSSNGAAMQTAMDKLTAEGWAYTLTQVGQQWQASASIAGVNRFGRPRHRNLPALTGDTRAEALALLALVQIKHPLADDLDLAPGNPSAKTN